MPSRTTTSMSPRMASIGCQSISATKRCAPAVSSPSTATSTAAAAKRSVRATVPGPTASPRQVSAIATSQAVKTMVMSGKDGVTPADCSRVGEDRSTKLTASATSRTPGIVTQPCGAA